MLNQISRALVHFSSLSLLSFLLGSHFQAKAFAEQPALVALVSTNSEAYQAFDAASEAIEAGAKIILFPEWGFLEQGDIDSASIENWKKKADEADVYILLGARYDQRNTVFVFHPEGTMSRGVRRDGYNSPVPNTPDLAGPLTFVTPFGKAGVLLCDESRNQSYIQEMAAQGISFLLVPNNVGFPISLEELNARYEKIPLPFDAYHVDKMGFQGHQSHVFRKATQTFEINAFGAPTTLGSNEGFKVNAQGLKYRISYHPLTQ